MKQGTETDNDLTIERTDDGSSTLYRSDIDEHYHSTKGALAESLHVYVETGWRKAAENGGPVRVFEVGFGTGLNASLTAEAALRFRIITEYYSVELHPLAVETALSLDYGNTSAFHEAVTRAPWGERIEINPFFTLVKTVGNFLTMELPHDIDAVYFDAFAPEKQPEMWDDAVFARLHDSMADNGVLTTYCAKGVVRRRIQDAGFTTERLPGPPNGKREILRATKKV